MKKLLALAALSLAVSTGSVLAHGAKPRHGGIVQTADDLQFELLNKKEAAHIYVEDHGINYPVDGAKGKLTVLNGTEKTEVALHPAGDNILEARGDAKLAPGAKAVASITFANKKTVTVRFSIKK